MIFRAFLLFIFLCAVFWGIGLAFRKFGELPYESAVRVTRILAYALVVAALAWVSIITIVILF